MNERAYVSTPTLVWQAARPPIHYQNPQFEAFYNGWMREQWIQGRSDSFIHLARHFGLDVMKFVNTLLWPELCLPLLAIWWMWRDRGVSFLMAQVTFCFFGFLLVAWFQPHYVAPMLAAVFALLVQGIRHVRRWECGGRPVGIGLTRAIAAFAVLLAPFHPHSAGLNRAAPSGIEFRPPIQARLNAAPGTHLVIVRYTPQHDVLMEWVYNGADIDHAKVVWAREIPGMDLKPLLNYFRGTQVWVLEPDASPPQLTPYAE